MKIEAYSVVTLKYTLKDKHGNVVDQSDENDPLVYMQGTDYLVPGLEAALQNHEKGDCFSTVVKAEDGYGTYDEDLVQEIPLANFGGVTPEIGAAFVAQTEEGVHPVVIKEINGDQVKVDANHPMAGCDLYFDLEVLDVREPTDEEREHRHVHLHGHCCHHDHDEHEHGCCHGHHHDDDDGHEHKCCHGHHHDDEDEHEHKCCHGHHHDDEDRHEHKCCHRHHHDE